MEDQRRIIFNALKDRFDKFYRFEDFCKTYQNWQFEYIYKQDLCIGATIINNGYIHVIIDEPYRKRWASKNLIKKLIEQAMIDGVAKTTIFKDDDYRITFAKRLGFTLIKDGNIQTYEVKHEDLWR